MEVDNVIDAAYNDWCDSPRLSLGIRHGGDGSKL